MIQNLLNAEHYRWGTACDGWRLLQRPDLSVIQERIPPGSGELKHFHGRARQCFFLLRGRLTIEIQDKIFCLVPGDALEVEPGAPHRVHNEGDEDAVFLVISAPSTAGDRVNL